MAQSAKEVQLKMMLKAISEKKKSVKAKNVSNIAHIEVPQIIIGQMPSKLYKAKRDLGGEKLL